MHKVTLTRVTRVVARRALVCLVATCVVAGCAVRAGWTQAAAEPKSPDMRALLADPAVRNFVGMSENNWNFNAPDSIPGFGSIPVIADTPAAPAREKDAVELAAKAPPP